MKTLTISELRKIVPAAFAEEPADTVSDRYSFIPTEPIIEELLARGWAPVNARQSHRVVNKRHATHMIEFQQPGNGIHRVDDYAPQIVLFNNHAAQRRFVLRAGIFVKVCSNGLVVAIGIGSNEIAEIHIDGAKCDIDEAFSGTLIQLEQAATLIPKWQQVHLNFVQQNEYAARAVLIKNNNDKYWSKHFDAHEFLNRRRFADRKDDLWTVFNVVQENIMMGGVQGASRTTKPINQVVEVQRINEALWQLTTEYGKLHGVN